MIRIGEESLSCAWAAAAMRDEGCDVDKLFAGEVPAALRLDLVFDMEGGAGAVIGGEGPGDHVGTCVL